MKNTPMSDYIVVEAIDLAWLESKVKSYLNSGYIPLGGATPVYTIPDNSNLHTRTSVDFNSNNTYQSIFYTQTLYKPINQITLT